MIRGMVASLSIFVAACASTLTLEGPTPLATIPLEVRRGLPTVNVRIGEETLKLFLDLGGHQGIALTTSELGRVKVRYLDSWSEFRNSKDQILRARQFVAEGVLLGAFHLGNVRGGEAVMGASVPPDQNGYIGLPVLQSYLLVFDYPKNEVRLYPPGDSAALAVECPSKSFGVSLVNGIAVSEAMTEHGKRLFIWDTGATDNFIRPPALPSNLARGQRIDDGPPIVRIEKLVLDDLEIGPQTFRVIPFGAPAVDGYLGAGLFSSRKVCLNISKGKGAVQ